jgi:HD-like signal output (HDOD) protein
LQDGRKAIFDAEKEIFGFDHSEIGSECCERWNFPHTINHAIRYHHDPTGSKEDELSHFLYLADFIATIESIDSEVTAMMRPLDEKIMSSLELQFDDVAEIRQKTLEAVEKLGI